MNRPRHPYIKIQNVVLFLLGCAVVAGLCIAGMIR